MLSLSEPTINGSEARVNAYVRMYKDAPPPPPVVKGQPRRPNPPMSSAALVTLVLRFEAGRWRVVEVVRGFMT
jgi:hypothetical protein